MAAEGYAKASGNLGVCCVTTGCGSTNALTGVLGAWQDSTPMLVLAGQVPVLQTIASTGLPLRQFGVQEGDILPMVDRITKYARRLDDPAYVLFHLEKACQLATHGRPGPAWLDVPMDVQTVEIENHRLLHYGETAQAFMPTAGEIQQVKQMLAEAVRPVVIIGQGVRLARAQEELAEFVAERHLPVYASWMGLDSDPAAIPIGRDCTEANEAIRAADLVLVIGSRLSLPSVCYAPREFAPRAKVVVVDVDVNEHRKPGVPINLFIHADAGEFLRAMKGAA
jgi:acetolactate synthase-1/2/3 large subunit